MSVQPIGSLLGREEDDERWRRIPDFEYKISDNGRVRSERTGRIMVQSQNQYGLVQVGIVRDGVQHHRSVPLLVARAFVLKPFPAFDTPINMDGDRWNNHVNNLVWRPRWYAIKYNRQFRHPYPHGIPLPIEDVKNGDVYENSFECSRMNGILEEDLVVSIINNTWVWPTYQQFFVHD